MKKIEISDELFWKLVEISKDMNKQNHRCTSMPYMFRLVQHKEELASDCDDADFVIWRNCDWEECFRVSVNDNPKKEAKKYLKENGDEDAIKRLNKLNEDYEVEEFLEEEGFSQTNMKISEEYVGYFLTEKSANKHFNENKHHYKGKKPKTYLDTCFRNPEMEAVQQFLCELTGGEIHK